MSYITDYPTFTPLHTPIYAVPENDPVGSEPSRDTSRPPSTILFDPPSLLRA